MAEHNVWLDIAKIDLKSAKKLIKDDDESMSVAIYLAHQSAEKALKAILVFHHSKVPKIHDLEELFDECFKLDQFVSVFKKQIVFLNQYEVNTRYPDDYFELTREEVTKGIQIAEQVLKVVATFLYVKI